MTSPKFGFALEYVSDIDAARRFYVDVLGLVAQREHPTFVQFEDFAIASDESLSGTRELELYWLVDDARAAFKELASKGEVTFPLKQLPFGTVFGLKGPTGQPRFVLELAQNRPSTAI
jgi:catechol 2,3-dioxygenase-like lactoylglutathione lyase family enzyme